MREVAAKKAARALHTQEEIISFRMKRRRKREKKLVYFPGFSEFFPLFVSMLYSIEAKHIACVCVGL